MVLGVIGHGLLKEILLLFSIFYRSQLIAWGFVTGKFFGISVRQFFGALFKDFLLGGGGGYMCRLRVGLL